MESHYLDQAEREEFNLTEFLATILRRWQFALSGVVVGGCVAAISTSFTDKVWEGSFDIVVESSEGSASGTSLGSTNSVLSSLAGLANGKQASALESEVKILQSPSVLMPIYESLRARKASLRQDIGSFDFSDFSDNLSVNLAKGTSILTVSYRDTQKDLILPVLNDIYREYQSYSQQERRESLSNGIEYTKEQVNIYRKRADASLRRANSFAMTYGISGAGSSGNSMPTLSNILKSEILKGGSSNFDINTPNASASQRKGDPLSQLADLNQELIRLEQTFTSKDPKVVAVRKERDALRIYLESSALGNIAYPGSKRLTRDQAQSLFLKFQELERQSQRDKSTLESLERGLLSLQLEEARSTKPWRIISTPSLQTQPISPIPVRNFSIGASIGLVIGIGSALFVDRLSGKIYDKDRILKLLPVRFLGDLERATPDEFQDTLRLIKQHYFKTDSIALLPLSKGPSSSIGKISRDLNAIGAQCKICSTFSETLTLNQVLIVAEKGLSTHDELIRASDKLKLHNELLSGWIWIGKGA